MFNNECVTTINKLLHLKINKILYKLVNISRKLITNYYRIQRGFKGIVQSFWGFGLLENEDLLEECTTEACLCEAEGDLFGATFFKVLAGGRDDPSRCI